MSTTIERAHPEDLDRVLDLLDRHGLPLDGASGLGDTLLVARLKGQIVGAAGLELYADGALLRSVVVDASVQGRGLGQRLTEAALALACDRDMPTVFLLTTTADRFFPRFGFEPDQSRRCARVRAAVGGVSVGMSGLGYHPAEAPPMRTGDLSRRLAAEALGTAMLLAAVVGSGIMGERLARGNEAIALLANTAATVAALGALILTFGPISGGHFNPAVSVADAWQGGLRWREVPGYVAAQLIGAVLGVWIAHVMFGERMFMLSLHARAGSAQLVSEFVATFGLLSVIWGCSRSRPDAVPFAVAAYIAAAYWFTASTSFANPAVTLARALTDTFAGIRPADVPGFIVAQLAGAATATILFRWLVPSLPLSPDRVVVPRTETSAS